VPDSQKYPRNERLTRRKDYLTVYREGVKRVSAAVICYATRQEGRDTKFGLAVSRKVGKAVVRNRIKRYLREIYRSHRTCLAEGTHLVVVARPEAASLDFHQMRDAVRQTVRRIGGVTVE
jgi:ribonuclease P protein component